jgi:hypothetical protein
MPDYIYPAGCKVRWERGWVLRPSEIDRPHGIASACWHAGGKFFRELFNLNPNGKIITALARYDGMSGFNDNFPATAAQNVGSQICPVYTSDACACHIWDTENF